MTVSNAYIPGVCNIGPAETRKRALSGWIGLAMTLGLAALLYGFHNPPVARLLLFFPAFSAFSGYWQARLHFCLKFGILGVHNFGDLGQKQKVEQGSARALDRQKAIRVLIYSAVSAGAVAVAAFHIG